MKKRNYFKVLLSIVLLHLSTAALAQVWTRGTLNLTLQESTHLQTEVHQRWEEGQYTSALRMWYSKEAGRKQQFFLSPFAMFQRYGSGKRKEELRVAVAWQFRQQIYRARLYNRAGLEFRNFNHEKPEFRVRNKLGVKYPLWSEWDINISEEWLMSRKVGLDQTRTVISTEVQLLPELSLELGLQVMARPGFLPREQVALVNLRYGP
jgi:hypothetical protein